MPSGRWLTVLVAVVYIAVALAATFLPPVDLLQRLRAGVYTAYFSWGVVSADGSHAYGEAHGYKIAVNLWKVVICDPSGRCTSQNFNAIGLYTQLRASGALSIEGIGGGCYRIALKPTTLAQRVISAEGVLCLEQSGAPSWVNITLTIDGEGMSLIGKPIKVSNTFLYDSYLSIHGD
ncbi:hypothetical protein [Pyrobaculum sp.]|uniref:hypothetical protein n=1 Tax=Pyrobaculum sp. TaxID=2004705 RepID=UPI0031659490